MRNKVISSSEIAKLVGVSRSTVSKVINNYPDIPEKTKEDIKKVIRKYNYHPNAAAQVLAGKKTKTIGLFMSAMNSDIGDYLFNFIVVRVVENFSMRGYHVIINTINDIKDPVCRELIKEVFYQGWVDAGLFLEFESNEPLIEELIEEGFIVAAVDKCTTNKRERNRLIFNFDNYTPARQAVDYLVGLNHSRIAVINGEIRLNSGDEKFRGFMDGLAEHSVILEESWIRYGKFSITGGYENMKQILNSPAGVPTAVCCANDSIAFGALKAINEAGLRVPEDISLIGIDDHMQSAHIKPALTTFRVDFTTLLGQLTEKVIEVIEDEVSEPVQIRLGTEFIERDSCRRIQVDTVLRGTVEAK